MRYHGITHGVPLWLLPLWRKFRCPKNIHAFDEVSSLNRNYLYCDACHLIVEITFVDTQYQTVKMHDN